MKEFMSAMQAAVVKAGIDLTGLHVFSVTLDQTWGDLQGYAFAGPTAVAERAARFCEAWHSKHFGDGSYARQRNVMYRGLRKAWLPAKELRAAGYETQYPHGNAELEAYCTSVVYYPCYE